MEEFIESVWFASAYLMGVGVSLSSDVSLVFYIGVGLFALCAYMSFYFRKRQLAQKDSYQSADGAAHEGRS